jgi:methionine aminopeptidase
LLLLASSSTYSFAEVFWETIESDRDIVFTVEPMINMGKANIVTDKYDNWTVRTADGKPSTQWEKTVLVTETGYEVLAY